MKSDEILLMKSTNLLQKLRPVIPNSGVFQEVLQYCWLLELLFLLRDHSFSTYAKFSEKLTFLTPDTCT